MVWHHVLCSFSKHHKAAVVRHLLNDGWNAYVMSELISSEKKNDDESTEMKIIEIQLLHQFVDLQTYWAITLVHEIALERLLEHLRLGIKLREQLLTREALRLFCKLCELNGCFKEILKAKSMGSLLQDVWQVGIGNWTKLVPPLPSLVQDR